ncbi:MAG: dihydropteroate synthase [Pseudomonadota bacterium]
MSGAPAAGRRPLVMGVVNVTPDSFSDGGLLVGAEGAVAHALALDRAGADILDIGGESTRPGARPVSAEEEAGRILPVIRLLRPLTHRRISVDTCKPDVARAAVEAGADIWNDVTALGAPGAADLAAELACDVVLMHMQGEPRTMQAAPRYEDVLAEVCDFLEARARAALDAGVARERIWLDPGIGFGKTLAHNLALLAGLGRIVALGFPVLLGASRKRFIAAVGAGGELASDRLGGSLAAALAGARAGVAAVRVHDVAQTLQALEVQAAIAAGAGFSPGR